MDFLPLKARPVLALNKLHSFAIIIEAINISRRKTESSGNYTCSFHWVWTNVRERNECFRDWEAMQSLVGIVVM